MSRTCLTQKWLNKVYYLLHFLLAFPWTSSFFQFFHVFWGANMFFFRAVHFTMKGGCDNFFVLVSWIILTTYSYCKILLKSADPHLSALHGTYKKLHLKSYRMNLSRILSLTGSQWKKESRSTERSSRPQAKTSRAALFWRRDRTGARTGILGNESANNESANTFYLTAYLISKPVRRQENSRSINSAWQ